MKLFKLDSNYYKNKLSASEKDAYNQILCGVRNCIDSIKVPNVESNNYEKVMHAVLMDHPKLVHFNSGSISFDGRSRRFIPKYIMSGVEYRDRLSECTEEIKFISKQMKSKDTWGSLLWLHSELMSRIRYRDNGISSHTIAGPLLNGMGVCEGIAKTVKSICDEMSIPCVVVEGRAQQGRMLAGNHAWNAIYADGAWNFYDFTFDITIQQNNPCSTIERNDYFCILRSEMEKDHFEWSSDIVDDGKRRDYFRTNNLYVRNQKELLKLMKSSKKKDFAYKIDESWKNFDVNKVLTSVMNDYANAQNKVGGYTCSYNEALRVVYFHIH